MANDYDWVLKENIEQVIIPIAEKLPDFTKKAVDQH